MHRNWAAVKAAKGLRDYVDGGLGLSQTELAKTLGVKPTTIYTWKIGYRRPGPEFRAALNRIAGIRPDDWLTDAERVTARRLRTGRAA